jgi:hypothetical protein
VRYDNKKNGLRKIRIMKSTHYILLLFLLIFSACSHENIVPNTNDQTGTGFSEDNDGDEDESEGTEEDDDDDIETGGTNLSEIDTTAVATTDNLTICFKQQIRPVLSSNCAVTGCHNTISRASGYDFSSYATTMQSVIAGNPAGSRLYKVISGNGGNSMPPAPNDKMTTDNIQLIYQWISEGAKNTTCGG